MRHDTKKPNILFIMDDQHRFDYLGIAMGYPNPADPGPAVRTPNLDRLAARGVHFTQCTTNCPVCAPSRIGLATGLQPSRVGALDNASYLPRSVPTYYQRLRDHGYRVGCVGKLDLAKPDGYNGRYGDRPCVYGWGFTHPEECEGKMHAGRSCPPQGPYTYYLQEQGLLQAFCDDYRDRAAQGWIKDAVRDSVLPTAAFEDAYIGRRAAAWIEAVPDDFPWHYFVSFVGPHNPFDPPTEYADRYRNAPMPEAIQDTLEDKPAWVKRRVVDISPELVTVTRRQYCGLIELIDDQVGIILDALERRGMLEDTYIVFSSDHGEMLGDHGLYTKSVAYEGALHVPLIITGPEIAGGRTSDALVELIDVNATICELAGLPPQANIDARSLGPVLRGEAPAHRSETVSAHRHFRCIRTDRYKLIENYNDVVELYDLIEDPAELHNLEASATIAPSHPDLVRDLRKKLSARFLEGQWRR